MPRVSLTEKQTADVVDAIDGYLQDEGVAGSMYEQYVEIKNLLQKPETAPATTVNIASATHHYHASAEARDWISYSQVADFLQCRWRWRAKYVYMIRPRVTPKPMALGDAVHRGIASFLAGGMARDGIEEWKNEALALVPEDLMDYEVADGFQNIVNIAIGLVDRILSDIKGLGWEVIYLNNQPAVEIELAIPLQDYINRWDGYISHIDAIMYDPVRQFTWLVDWKVRGQLQGDSAEETNLQHAGYMHVCRENGIPITGSISFQTLNKLPAIPKLNKDGSMSRTRIATDWETYSRALRDNGLNPAIYRDMKDKLDTEWTRAVKAYRSDAEVTNVWHNIILPAIDEIYHEFEKLDTWGIQHVPLRSMSFFNCERCAVRSICLNALRDYDVLEPLRVMEYDAETVNEAIMAGVFR